MTVKMNRAAARRIAQSQALHAEAQQCLEETIFTELQLAQNRGAVITQRTKQESFPHEREFIIRVTNQVVELRACLRDAMRQLEADANIIGTTPHNWNEWKRWESAIAGDLTQEPNV